MSGTRLAVELLTRLGAQDAGEVLTLQRAAYVTEAQAHEDVDLPPLRQLLAEVAGELADPEANDAQVAEVGRFTVVPDRQGQGLGTRLLAAVEEQLPASVKELQLFAGEHSDGNLRLYARLGYRETYRQATPAGYRLVYLTKHRTTSD